MRQPNQKRIARIENPTQIGLVAIEGIPREAYKAVKEIGLEISLVSSHGFGQGPCNPKFRDEVITKLTEAIDVAKSVGSKRVITFTGMRFDGMDETKARYAQNTEFRTLADAMVAKAAALGFDALA